LLKETAAYCNKLWQFMGGNLFRHYLYFRDPGAIAQRLAHFVAFAPGRENPNLITPLNLIAVSCKTQRLY